VTSVLALLGGVVGTAVGGIALLQSPGPIARPVPDRWHLKATPVTGGFALFAGFLVALGAVALAGQADRRLGYVVLGATCALLLGFADDERWIGPRTKFSGQLAIAAVAAIVIRPHWLPPAAAISLATFVLVAAMNSFNLLDNIDGLAAGTAAIAAGTLALMTFLVSESHVVRILACAVAGTCAGFLPLNYRRRRPAALFMGDSGALLLGLLVGACALLATPGGAGGVSVTVVAPLLILALPILDTSLVILVRLAEHRPVWRGGRDHLSHRLVYVGLGERQAVAALLLLAAACAGTALVVVAFDDPLVTGAAAGAVVALLVGLGSRLALVREPFPVSALLTTRQEAAQLEPLREHAHAN
jgi:UDP-GlcNAc:undecaprenyl-phosphate/decaprenyl-phosphate GlcNAc-1-phosphate transferase